MALDITGPSCQHTTLGCEVSCHEVIISTAFPVHLLDGRRRILVKRTALKVISDQTEAGGAQAASPSWHLDQVERVNGLSDRLLQILEVAKDLVCL
jgi:hypothetical protein